MNRPITKMIRAFRLPLALLSLSLCAFTQSFASESPAGTWAWESEFQGEKDSNLLTFQIEGESLEGEFKRGDLTVSLQNGTATDEGVRFQIPIPLKRNKVWLFTVEAKILKGELKGIYRYEGDNGVQEEAFTAQRKLTPEELLGIWKLHIEGPDGITYRPESSLPNVLIYGDSISAHYYPYVEELLKNKVNLHRMPPQSDWDSSHMIPYMNAFRTEIDSSRDFRWHVVHFNFGLHDMKRYNDQGKKDREHGTMQIGYHDYAANLEANIRWLQSNAPSAKLIFATTTPVPEGEPRRRSTDSIKLNRIARDIIAKFPDVSINELYAFTLPHHAEWKIAVHDVHFNETGRKAQGEKVASAILDVLGIHEKPLSSFP